MTRGAAVQVLERASTADAEQQSPKTGRPIVEVRGVTKTFGAGAGAVVALDDVVISVAAGEFFALLGPSGCGKTTLLRLLAGFGSPDSGTVRLDGRDVVGDPPNRRQVNTVFQSYALFPHMSVARNVAFGLERKGLGKAAVARRVEEMLALVRLDSLASRRPHALSGGQQQRVALARALAPQPRLLLLDEPLSALDPKLRRQMQLELKRLQRETGVTFLLVTHDQEEALSVADRIAVMDRGKILQVGPPREIYERPNCRFVADFTGANVVPGALAQRSEPFLAIRPDRVTVREVGATGLIGHVSDVTYRGATCLCVVVLDAGPTLLIERADLPETLMPGQRVACLLEPNALVALEY